VAGRSRIEALSFIAETRRSGDAEKFSYSPLLRASAMKILILFLATAALDAQGLDQAERLWKARDYDGANEVFKVLVDREPGNALYRVRWGRMYLDHFQPGDAADLFDEALKIEPNNAGAMLGKALIAAEDYGGNSAALARKALDADPKLVEAQELLARLALEDDNRTRASEEAHKALALDANSAAGKAVLASIDWLADKKETQWDPNDARGYELAAHFFILNRRYDEAIQLYRKAVALDPNLYSALSQLGVTLMRLGFAEEAFRDLETCYDNHFRDAATVNSLRLLDKEKNYTAFATPQTVLKVNKKEADALHPYFEGEMQRDIADYEKKYRFHLARPVEVQVYPDHEDFAVRTLGVPGIPALGVTFNDVIAMDSPSGRAPGDFHWASTLRHEMSHVFILAATNYRVPRWFTEGLAVHEETEASPEWGDPITPDVLAALRDKKLLPIADLDRGFVHPEYPSQMVVSYFQAGRICDFIQSRWSADKLLDMVHAFAQRTPTADVVRQTLGVEPEEFDKQFMEWLNNQVGKEVANFDEWVKDLKALAQVAKEKQYDAVLEQGEKVRQMYPDYVYTANAYEFLAEAYLAKGNKKSAEEVLTDYEKRGGRNPEALKKLASLEEEHGDKVAAAATLDRINYFYPVNDEDLHKHLGTLWFDQKNYAGALREFTAVIALHPLDQADAQYNLARAYLAEGERDKAEEHILASLEAAPGFRPAQQMLLQIEDSEKGKP
jgi:tetratricopeptide (TPR) repeat protein